MNRFLKSDNFWTMGPFDPKFGITLFFEVYFHPWEFRKKNFFRLLDRFWNRLTIEPRDWFCSKKFFGHFKVCTNTPPIPKSPHPIVYGAFWFENVLFWPQIGGKPVITSEPFDQSSPKKSWDLTFWPSTRGPNFRALGRSELKIPNWVHIGAYVAVWIECLVYTST